MTPIDYKALAERIEAHAECHANVELYDDEQRQWADDLRTVVSLLEERAEAPSFAERLKAECKRIGVERVEKWAKLDCEDMVEQAKADAVTGYSMLCEALDAIAAAPHPAPQPQPAQPPKCGCRSCLTPAELLSTFVVCPKCGNKRCPKADDHRNACTDSNAPGQAPQPERQSASEPTEAQIPDYLKLQIAGTAAAHDVLVERRRQIKAEGWSPEHDDEHDGGDLALAAAAYALDAGDKLNPYSQGDGGGRLPDFWPQSWHASWWKPGDPRRNLVKAGALILAEIERLDRAGAKESTR